MTLGIAVLEDKDAWLLSDTKFTFDEKKSGKKPLYGLKVFFLDRYTSIAYATNVAVETAHRRICEIYNCLNYIVDFAELVKTICDKFDQDVDFILARSGECPAIAKISNGFYAIETQKGLYWIGNRDAAQLMLTAYDRGLNELRNRMEGIMLSPYFPDVGGHAVVVRGTVEGFKYSPSMQLVSPYYMPIDDDWHTVDFGRSQTGGFGYTTITPKDVGVNGWGVYYFQGFYGEYWHVDLQRNICERLVGKAKTVSDFVALLEGDIGVKLEAVGSLG